MQGWVTWLGASVKICTGVAAILTAVAGVITHYLDPSSSLGITADAAIAAAVAGAYMVGQGISTIGLGRKLDKIA